MKNLIITTLLSSILFLASGCETSGLLQSAGKAAAHVVIKKESSEMMVSFLNKNPEAVEKLPQLDIAWKFFWEGSIDDIEVEAWDKWIEQQKLLYDPEGYYSFEIDEFSRLLKDSVREGELIVVNPKTRRIVNSFVDGLRIGYNQWIGSNS